VKEKTVKPLIIEPVKSEPEEKIQAVESAAEVAEIVESTEESAESKEKKKRYFEAVGRRKTAIARVRLLTIKPFEGDEGKITVNEKFYKIYFPTLILQQTAEASLRRLKSLNRFEIVAKVKGGGIQAQAEALRHGMARVLVLFNQDFRKKLKKAGYMKRDPRVKERRKYGLKKARKAPQWQKR
jgi:small subunit ribosomal protein S9